ncbi:hypothetical protein, partial [Acinetobacter baumannii]|uniref:hypothetical protein n=1 Tax=Acinetobacter baumannii TaxID=470 RepID=UPI003396519C
TPGLRVVSGDVVIAGGEVHHATTASWPVVAPGIVLEQGRVSFQGDINSAITYYHDLVLSGKTTDDGRPAHVLFVEEPQPEADFSLTSIELLDQAGAPKPD